MVTLDQCGWLGDAARLDPVPAERDDLVEHGFVLDMRQADHRDWIVLPDTAAHLIVHLGTRAGASDRRVTLVGARTRATRLDVRARSWTVGLRLRPGALPALTGRSAREFTDRGVPASDVWGVRAKALLDEVARAPGPWEVLAVLRAGVARLARTPERDWRARALMDPLGATAGRIRIRDVAARMGVAERTLRDASGDLLGLSPKRAARIVRLHRSVSELRGVTRPGWTRLAARAGYTDQSHLIREFGALLDETPEAFLRRGHRDVGAASAADSSNPEG